MHIYKVSCIDIYVLHVVLVSKGQVGGVYNLLGLSLSLPLSHCMSLFLSVSHLHSLSSRVSLSLKAIHIQHNNPYKHLFLFMSLSFAHHSCTNANVNIGIGVPWGSFTHHTCEQKTHSYLPGSAFVRAPDCHPRAHYYRHSHTSNRITFIEKVWTLNVFLYFLNFSFGYLSFY